MNLQIKNILNFSQKKAKRDKKISCEPKEQNFLNDKMKKLLKLTESELKILNTLYKSICIDENETYCISDKDIFDKVKRTRTTVYTHLNRLI